MERVDITIIGAGIIGLSLAYRLSRDFKSIIVIEENPTFGQETSSRNSEVIHTGLYYEPDSLKAKLCIKGRELLYTFCDEHNIKYEKCAKLVVAFNSKGETRIQQIYENAIASGVKDLRFLEKVEVKKLEPDIFCGKAFLCPQSGIIDSHGLMDFLYKNAKAAGVTFSFSTKAIGIDKDNGEYIITVEEPAKESFKFESNIVINAAGLFSDKIAEMAGIDTERAGYNLHYCKGQYFRVNNPKKFSIKRLVYPPATQISLGIHITPDLGSGLRLGPDANYVDKINYDVNDNDKYIFYNEVRKFLPSLEADNLIPDTAGIRPKLQGPDDGFKDFIIREESDKGLERFINCIGIESPGLTATLAIAEYVENIIKVA
jgi:L-2-hydroxyglutarate oxidase LhgO